jgi:acetyl-CoA C-acetyltransferase
MTVTMGIADKETSQIYTKEVTIAADEGIRADTTYESCVGKIKTCAAGGRSLPATQCRSPTGPSHAS